MATREIKGTEFPLGDYYWSAIQVLRDEDGVALPGVQGLVRVMELDAVTDKDDFFYFGGEEKVNGKGESRLEQIPFNLRKCRLFFAGYIKENRRNYVTGYYFSANGWAEEERHLETPWGINDCVIKKLGHVVGPVK